MLERFPRLALLLALSAPFALPALVRADDPPPDAPKTEPAPPAPEAPKPAEPEKPKKAETDDTSIFKDWKLVKQRGLAHARARAEFWVGKGAEGKDLIWLGCMWDRGESYDKAVEALEGFLAYTPPATDEKAKTNNLTNREKATKDLIGIYTKAKKFDKAVAIAQKFREEFASSPVVTESYDDEGRAQRLAGDDEKAAAAFAQAAQGKFIKGLMDLVDVHLANGDVEAAKGAFDKLPKDDSAGFRDKFVQDLKAFVDAVGTPVADLDKMTSVGRGAAPSLAGKPTLFYFWHMQMSLADRKLAAMAAIQKNLGDAANVAGVSKYNHYSPETEKIDAAMTPEQEVDWYKKFIERFSILVPCFAASDDVIAALKMKYEGQFVIVDGEGKLRYMRINGEQPYDREVAELALKKAAAAKK